LGLQLLGVALGVTLMGLGLGLGIDPYQDVIAFRHAKPCPIVSASSGHQCIARESGRFAGKHIATTTDQNGTTSRSYVVEVVRASGETERLDVDSDLYNAARRGADVALETWRGHVVNLSVQGKSSPQPAPSAYALGGAIFVAWSGVGLFLWGCLCRGRLRSLFGPMGFRTFGWLFLGLWTMLFMGPLLIYGIPWPVMVFLVLPLWAFGAVISGYFVGAIDDF
jgi:hypothetical protein